MKSNSFMTPVSTLFMLIAISPYIGMRFGHISLLILMPFIIYLTYNAYQFYKNKSFEKDISYAEALESDLPDMSPIHFVLFILIAAPIFLLITGGNFEAFLGIALIWIIYTVYYYGFKER